MLEKQSKKVTMAEYAYEYFRERGINRVCSSVSHGEFSELVRDYYKMLGCEEKCPHYAQGRNDKAMQAIRSTKIGQELFIKTSYVMNLAGIAARSPRIFALKGTENEKDKFHEDY